jgi:hypothetical protein
VTGLRGIGTAVVVTALLAATAVSAGAQSGGGSGGKQSLEATDKGITPTTIRIAVLADVENPLQPGLFKGSADAMAGFEDYINSHGGLAGRKLKVDFIDTHLSADETRNAIVTACDQDFAIVGTTSLFVNNIDDMTGCVDAAGKATGLPDFPVLTTEPVHQCSPVSHPINPPTLDCATIDQHPQTYRGGAGPTAYYLKRFGKLSGVFLYPSDLKSAKNSQVPNFTAQQKKGIKLDADYDVSARAQQSAYTPIAQSMKQDGTTYARSGLAFSSTVTLRKEAKLQGVTSVKVWDCSIQCYNQQLIQQGGADVEGQFVYFNIVPFFNEAKANPMTANFVKYTGKDKVDGFGAQAWASGVYFRDSVNKVVKQGGNNALTRERVLQAAGTINGFTADGMIGKVDLGKRVPSPCFALLQVKNGAFTRVYPKKPGSFDCNPSNVVTLKLDLITGT